MKLKIDIWSAEINRDKYDFIYLFIYLFNQCWKGLEGFGHLYHFQA